MTRILQDYMTELAMGGYSFAWRADILKTVIVGYKRMWTAETKGEGFINRPDNTTKSKRRAAKLTGSSTWFQKPREISQNPVKSAPISKKNKENTNIPPKIEILMFCPFIPFS